VIPPEFIARFGELSEYTYSMDTISNFAHHEQISKEAEEFCWTAADQFHWSAPRIVTGRVKEGIDFRSVLPENLVPPVGFKPAEGVKRRVYPNLNVVAIASDKEAVFGLPYLNGRMDYAQFFSKDPKFIKWCKDLFVYFWERGKPMTFPFPENS
jgi:predicted transcriptional regulator